ncbi:hypothetical protein Tco_0903664 [Tanacetum coccineum]
MAFVQEKNAEYQGKIGADDTEVVNTADEGVSTAASRTPPTTTTVFDDEDVTMAMAQTLIKMNEEKAKEKGVAIKDVEDLRSLQWKKEREQFTIEQRAQFLVETIAAQRKFRAAQRAVEIRSKPPTKTQLRNMMITYLKNMDSEKEEKKSLEPESEGKKGKRIMRVTDSALKQKSSKKQQMMQEQESAKSDEDATADYEHKKEELRMWLTVVPDEEEAVDP